MHRSIPTSPITPPASRRPRLARLLAALALSAPLWGAQAAGPAVEARDAWVRATVPGQKATGAFMTLKAAQATRLVGVESPVAGVAEVHEMKLDDGVMRMRALPQGLELPAGQPVALKSGGYHLMLMDLKQQVVAGSSVPVTLKFRNAKGEDSTLVLQLSASTSAPAH